MRVQYIQFVFSSFRAHDLYSIHIQQLSMQKSWRTIVENVCPDGQTYRTLGLEGFEAEICEFFA